MILALGDPKHPLATATLSLFLFLLSDTWYFPESKTGDLRFPKLQERSDESCLLYIIMHPVQTAWRAHLHAPWLRPGDQRNQLTAVLPKRNTDPSLPHNWPDSPHNNASSPSQLDPLLASSHQFEQENQDSASCINRICAASYARPN